MATRNISDIHNFIDFIIMKERGAFITPEEIDEALDAGQLTQFAIYFAPYGQNQTIHDALRPFRIYYPFTSASDGSVTFPSDYLHMLGSPFTVYGSTIYSVNFVNEDEWVNAVRSQLRPNTLGNPIARDTSTGFALNPQQQQIGFFTYLKRPAIPVYGYTQVGRVITYDPLTSTQLEWSDIYINAIIGQALKYLGVNLTEEQILQYGDQMSAENTN